jgi:AraC-like DNA-binding protein
LLVGQQLNPMAKGVLANLVTQAEDLGEALQIFQRNMALMSEGEHLRLEPAGRGLKLIYEFVPPADGHRFAVERSMSAALTWARALTGVELFPDEAGFRHGMAGPRAHYHALFGSGLRFAQAHDYLIMRDAHLRLPLRSANRYLKHLLSTRVETLLRGMAANEQVSRQVQCLIEAVLAQGAPSVGSIAKQLNMSRQTLHRRLQSEGLNYRQVLEATRRKRAIEGLSGNPDNLEGLSQSLGFSDLSAFFKAFKSWYGLSPRRYQQRLRASAGLER